MTGLATGRNSVRSETRGLGAASASADMRQALAGGLMTGLVQAAHVPADLLDVGRRGLQAGDDAATVDDQDTVGEAENLVEVGRDHEDAATSVAHSDQRPMDRL